MTRTDVIPFDCFFAKGVYIFGLFLPKGMTSGSCALSGRPLRTLSNPNVIPFDCFFAKGVYIFGGYRSKGMTIRKSATWLHNLAPHLDSTIRPPVKVLRPIKRYTFQRFLFYIPDFSNKNVSDVYL